jgi:hypothetical protein
VVRYPIDIATLLNVRPLGNVRRAARGRALVALFLSVRFLSQAGPPGALARFEVRGCRFTIKCLEERQGKAQITHIERAWSTHEGRKATIVASSGEVA